jgi:hypothetical protein
MPHDPESRWTNLENVRKLKHTPEGSDVHFSSTLSYGIAVKTVCLLIGSQTTDPFPVWQMTLRIDGSRVWPDDHDSVTDTQVHWDLNRIRLKN